jgi:hypothetical protein
MVTSGMKGAGYIHLNLDDNWMATSRDANGTIVRTIRADKAATYTFSRQDLNVGVIFIRVDYGKNIIFKTMIIY